MANAGVTNARRMDARMIVSPKDIIGNMDRSRVSHKRWGCDWSMSERIWSKPRSPVKIRQHVC